MDDLNITIETGQIEKSLNGNYHDDGVDIKLSLLDPFSLNGAAALNLDPAASKYSIGGNGFIDGHFIAYVPHTTTHNDYFLHNGH